MKLLRIIIFACLAHQITFLNLLSMENKKEDKNKLLKKGPESLSSSLSEPTKLKSPEKRDAKKNPSFNRGENSILQNVDLGKLPKDFKLLPIPDTTFGIFNQTESYAGILPKGTKLLIKSLLNISIIKKNLNPVLAKIVGPSDVGKTTLINTIAQRTSNPNCYSKIDLDEILSNAEQRDFYKADPEKYIESLIQKFYQPKSTIICPRIVAFTKGLPLKNKDFKKLRGFLLEIQKPLKIGPLLVLHEGTQAHEKDGNYHDKIIHIEKPSTKNIIAFLSDKFIQHSFGHEEITPETVTALEGSLPPYIQRIAEEVLRNAIVDKQTYITNAFIQKVLLQKQPLALSQN